MSAASVRGRFIWHELLTTDPAGAARFYTRVLGWTTESWPQHPEYTMFATGKVPLAGYMALPEAAKAMGAPPCWISYIGTPDVDETVRLATSLGARTLTDIMDVPTVGRFVTLMDPQNAVFAAFTPAGPWDRQQRPTGEFMWHEMIADDPDRAFGFYQRLFGWEKTESLDMGGMGIYQMYGWGKESLGGFYRKPPGMTMPDQWLPYVGVPDARRTAPAIVRAGGEVRMGPHQIPSGGWIAIAADPQGAAFSVHSAPAAMKPAARKAAKAKPAATKKKAATKKVKVAVAKRKTAPKKAKVARSKQKVAAKKSAAARRPKRASGKTALLKKATPRKRTAAKRTTKPKARRKPTAKRRARR
jgi:uncharacterized protein